MSNKTFLRRWFGVLFTLACYFVFAYPVQRLSSWFGENYAIGIIGGLGIWILSVMAMRFSFGGPNMKIRYIVVHWMGISFVYATLVLLAEPFVYLFDLDTKVTAVTVLAAGLFLSLVAVLYSHRIAVKQFEIPSHKVSRGYRIAQISDVHIGSRQGKFMEKVVKKLNDLDPDFVVITGDLIDSVAVELDALRSLGTLNATTLFSIGNHERYADVEKITRIADTLGIVTLRQAFHAEGDLHFIGIDDADDPEQVARHLPSIEKGNGKYNVLLYHRPLGWEAAVEHGIDLKLSGHTHNGQIFPFNLVVKQQFKRIRGMYINGDHRLYVSSGTGTWGPLMRLGSMSEISVFDVRPD